MKPTLYIIRGWPGSGKSTRAKQICKDLRINYYEADMYFIDASGKYNFDKANIGNAHAWCKDAVEREMQLGNSVVVSNTFTKRWELLSYLDMARKHNYAVQVETMRGNYKNVHSVPDAIVDRMKSSFEEIGDTQ